MTNLIARLRANYEAMLGPDYFQAATAHSQSRRAQAMSKELGQRSDAELAEMFSSMYSGWERGVNVTQERFGNGDTRFTETPMTPMELAARYVAAEVGANIYEIAGRAAFAPIIVYSQIQARIGPVFEEAATALEAKDAEIERLRGALEIIAGERQCVDNLMSHADVARAALNGGREKGK